LEDNAKSLLDQDYPDYEVRFIVESEDDPAAGVLQRIKAEKIVVAGRASDRGQKVHNLAYAIEGLRSAPLPPAIYVFADSDARYPRHWLSCLTNPLEPAVEKMTLREKQGSNGGRREAGISTGYRWYAPDGFHLPTLLRSAWNASVVSMLSNHKRNFAWGGSMAMRRETFNQLNILDAWQGAVSDDYAVTRAAQRLNVPIVFVPECLVPSYGRCTLKELLEFTTRQVIITRVYHPILWRAGFLGQIVFNTAFWSMLILQPAISAALFVLAAWKSYVRLAAVQSVLTDSTLSRFSWFYMLSPPLTALLYLYNMIRSALGTDIVWRQVHYRLVSPSETRVLGTGRADES
jgi:cellulose synthase/poly-beta-1,6-N-acetylglucosamine synthase-like glycosyltransferase